MSLAEHSGRKANGDDRPHQNPTVRRLRDSTPPPKRHHGPTWDQLKIIAGIVIATVTVTWFLSEKLGALGDRVTRLETQIENIARHLGVYGDGE